MDKSLLDLLKEIEIFGDLSETEHKIIKKFMFPYEYTEGSYVFKEGTYGNYMFFIVDGTVDVIKQMGTSKMVIATLSSGHSVGEMSLIDGETRSATVKATTDLKLIVLKQADFQALLQQHPAISNKVVMRISQLLSKSLRALSNDFTESMLSLY
jgi:CRP-like cAMP-binding protein|tara:strand:- start:14231 stop:14692 length:462 start_codon:yes stop_codon:yes gene_type:complete